MQTLSLDQLEQLTSILGADLRLTLIPGHMWASDRLSRKVMYPRDRILKEPADRATGSLWRTVRHALESFGEIDAYNAAVDAALEVEHRFGARAVHPRWILGIIMAAERERVERVARSGAHNLANTFLPTRWTGWRSAEGKRDRALINSKARAPEHYWNRVATAIGAIAAGVLPSNELPEDMRWSAPTVNAIQQLPCASTYDALIEAVEQIVPDLAETFLRFLQQEREESASPPSSGSKRSDDSKNAESDSPSPIASDGEQDDDDATSESDDAAPAPSASSEDDTSAADPQGGGPQPSLFDENTSNDADDAPGDEDEAGDGASFDAPDSDEAGTPSCGEDSEDPLDLPADLVDALNAAIDAIKNDHAEIDFFENAVADKPAAGWGNVPHTSDFKANQPGPAWSAVMRSARSIIPPLRRTVLAHLAENDVGAMEETASGRLNFRKVARPKSAVRPFRRRRSVDDHSYAVALILDRSGSMSAGTDGPAHEDVFGAGPLLRWHVCARTAVALAEAFRTLPNTELAIVIYDDKVELIKRCSDPLSPPVAQAVMNKVRAKGDNDDSGAINCAIKALQASSAERRFIIHLTDGQFCSNVQDVKRALALAERRGIEVAILTLDIEPTSARKFVPAHLADAVNDETLSRVLAKHLKRIIAA